MKILLCATFFSHCNIRNCDINIKGQKGFYSMDCLFDYVNIFGDLLFLGQNMVSNSKKNGAKIIQSFVESSDTIGYKKVKDYYSGKPAIAKLRIDFGQIIISANGTKCRTPKAFVLDILGEHEKNSTFCSIFDERLKYKKGTYVQSDCFDFSTKECSNGIHFFKTKEEAEAYEI